jgi:hypothetical protein
MPPAAFAAIASQGLPKLAARHEHQRDRRDGDRHATPAVSRIDVAAERHAAHRTH